MSLLSVEVATNLATIVSAIASANTDYIALGGETVAHSGYVPLGAANYASLQHEYNATPTDIIAANQATTVVNASSSSYLEPTISSTDDTTLFKFSVIADGLYNSSENNQAIDGASDSIDNNLQPMVTSFIYDSTYNFRVIEDNAESCRTNTGEYQSDVRASFGDKNLITYL